MATTNHSAAAGIHPGAYVQSGDPGAVGVGILWVDTSTSAPYQLKKRNASNTGWDNVGIVAAAVTTATASQASDVAMPSANTFYDVCTVSLGAGTWQVTGNATVLAGSVGYFTAKIWESGGPTQFRSAEMVQDNAWPLAFSLTVQIVLSGTTTIKFSCAASVASSTIQATAVHNGAGATEGGLTCTKVA